MSKFQDVTDSDLATRLEEQSKALEALFEIEAPTPEQVAEARTLAVEVEEGQAEVQARAAAVEQQAADWQALKDAHAQKAEDAKAAADAAKDADKDKPVEPAKDAEPVEPVAAEPVEPVAAEPTPDATPAAPVAASVRAVAAANKNGRPAVPASKSAALSLTASANVPDFNVGHQFQGLADLTDGIVSVMKGFTSPQGDGTSEDLRKFGVAKIGLNFADDMKVDPRQEDATDVFLRASQESRLASEQGQGSLVAAGGWCAPSETLYDLAADESLEGILSLPEVQVNRGGIRYTMGPQFADFYANAGFIQTEAQAIAGTTKPCYEVTCPTFTDVRLDAVGLCIKVPILTNAAYPELVQRFTSGTLIAHQHMVNANVIGRMVTSAGAARVFTGLGSSVSDSLEALTLVADQRRQTYRLPLSRTLEVVVPFWVKGMMLNDLGRRNGRDNVPATEAELIAHFTARNLKVSFVYDWTVLPAGQTYPTTFPALVYPAGTFVKGVSDVINLSAVYDAASLAVNTYTGLFMEQGLLVARMQYAADLLTLPVCNAGRTGAANFTCA